MGTARRHRSSSPPRYDDRSGVTSKRRSAPPAAIASGVRVSDLPRPLPPPRLPALPPPAPVPSRGAYVDTRRLPVLGPASWTSKIPRVAYFLCGMAFAVLIHYEATSTTAPPAAAPTQVAAAPVAPPPHARATATTASAGSRPATNAFAAPIPTVDVNTLPIAPSPTSADRRWPRRR
jgi:hypothetical protein